MADESLRSTLTAAFETAEKDDAAAPTEAPDTAVETAAVDDAVPAALLDDSSDDSNSGGAPAAPTPPAPVATPEAPKPPASWNATERESWAAMPEQARSAILRREAEHNRLLQDTSAQRRQAAKLDQIIEPYKPLLEKYNVGFEDAITPLLATRAALELGTPAQKAQLVANMIADFDIDVETLDSAIVHRAQHGAPPVAPPPPKIDLRSHPDLQHLFRMADEVQQRRQEQATEALAAVSSLPHFEEVREQMADTLDRARALGKTIDLQTAYDVACRIHGYAPSAPPPPSASEAGRALALSRRAASTVAGGMKPTPPRTPGSGTLRQELEANFAAAR